ncbi:hypothetical protein BSU04_38950 [Caballeronia sordidicola]|uniref:Uncharacterized protein n=1 Tax=Caballeronia sordidicola TaxID=196367 RepID=A0A226WR09_CABSO|nr:hypothetical protein BSU04_38950 [Caballeronia sordidicola]
MDLQRTYKQATDDAFALTEMTNFTATSIRQPYSLAITIH